MNDRYAWKSHQPQFSRRARVLIKGLIKGSNSSKSQVERASRYSSRASRFSRKKPSFVTCVLQNDFHISSSFRSSVSAVQRETYSDNKNLLPLGLLNYGGINAKREHNEDNVVVYENIQTAVKAIAASQTITSTPIVCLTDICKVKFPNMIKGSVADASDSQGDLLKMSETKSPKTRSPSRKGKVISRLDFDTDLKKEPVGGKQGANPRSVCPQEKSMVHKVNAKEGSETAKRKAPSNVKDKQPRNASGSSPKNSPKKKGKCEKEQSEISKDTKTSEPPTAVPEITITPPKNYVKSSPNSSSSRRKNISEDSEKSNLKGHEKDMKKSPTKPKTLSSERSPSRKGLTSKKKESQMDRKPTRNSDVEKKVKSECNSSPNSEKSSSASRSSSKSPKSRTPCTSPKLEVPDLSADSSKPTKRVRSPNARFKEDIILYPWETIRKSPKKSPTEKMIDTEVKIKEEYQESESVSTAEPSDANVGKTVETSCLNEDLEKQNATDPKCTEVLETNAEFLELKAETIEPKREYFEPKAGGSKTLVVPATRVLDFDSIPRIEKLNLPFTASTDYKYMYTGGVDKPRMLSDLIAKLNNSIEGTDNKLNDLLGQAEELDSEDEGEPYIPDENGGESNDSMDSDKTIIEFEGGANTELQTTEVKDIISDAGMTSARDNDEKDKSKGNLEENGDTVGENKNKFCESDKQMEPNQDKGATAEVENVVPEIVPSDNMNTNSTSSDPENSVIINNVSPDTSMNHEHEDCSDKDADNKNCDNKATCDSNLDRESNENCTPQNIFDMFGLSLKRRNKPGMKFKASIENLSEKKEKNEVSVLENSKKVNGSSVISTEHDIGNDHFEDIQPECNDKKEAKEEIIELLDDQDKVNNDDDCMVISDEESKKVVVVLSDDDCDKSCDETLSPGKKHKIATVDHSVDPAPLNILSRLEMSGTDKKSAFVSEELEKYIETNMECSITEVTKENDYEERENGDFKKPEPPPDVKSQLQNVEPDFDDIDGHIFLSFHHENALAAHLELEKSIDWLNETNIRKMAQMKLLKEKQGDAGSKRVTDIKSGEQQKQSFRGIPMRLLKYQKLLKKELEIILKINDQRTPEKLLSKSPEKTSDITKIKGWKKKFQNTEQLQEATGLHFSETGKLHWKTESRLLKNLDPDDVKDIGLDLKKKRRKLVNYSNKKKSGNKCDSKQEDDYEFELDDETAITEKDVYDEDEDKPQLDKLPYRIKYHSQHKYGARKLFVKKMGLDSKDEMILKKLGTQKLMNMRDREKRDCEESSSKRKEKPPVLVLSKLTQSMSVAAVSALDKKLMNRAKTLAKVEERKRMQAEQRRKAIETKEKEEQRGTGDGKEECDESMEATNTDSGAATAGSETEGPGSKDVKTTPTQEARQTRSRRSSLRDSGSTPQDGEKTDEKKAATHEACDKPGASQLKGNKRGCRYGCICHLCKFSDSGEEKETEAKPPCDKEYCRLGCICDSMDTKTGSQTHCRKPTCMFDCKCPPKQPKPDIPRERDRRGKKKKKKAKNSTRKHSSDVQEFEGVDEEPFVEEAAELEEEEVVEEEETRKSEDAEDWEPPSKRKRGTTNNRYANLPRRESTYRLAKNLDAVSRKALSVYESSEMYTEQRIRRRKSYLPDQPSEASTEADGFMPDGDLAHARQAIRKSFVEIATQENVAVQQQSMEDVASPRVCIERLNTEQCVLEISDDDDMECSPTSEELSAARLLGYNGKWKLPISKRHKKSQDSSQDCDGKRTMLSSSDVIDLVDSDEDNSSSTQTKSSESNLPSTSGLTSGTSAPETVTQKLGLAKNKVFDPEIKWKTQMVCLKAKKKSDGSSHDSRSEIKLLEIISNCQWESDRTNMLSKISHIISKDYQPNHVAMWGRYVLQFLPRADKPAVIPPELKSKLPNAMYSIRVRVTQCSEDRAKSPVKEVVIEDKKEEDASKKIEDEKKKMCMKQQKKLIEKIKFAERLRDLIKAEQLKGNEVSKFNVSLEGIEKALKRYKTQLWKAYTGSSNLTLAQLKKAVEEAKKGRHPTRGMNERVTKALQKISEKQRDMASAVTAASGVSTSSTLTASTLSRIQKNQGLKVVCNSVSSTDTAPKGFIPLSSLQKSGNSKQLIPLSASASAVAMSTSSTSSAITTLPMDTLTAHPVVMDSPSTNLKSTETASVQVGTPMLSSPQISQSEVLLIPVAEKGQSNKLDLNKTPLLSAKVAMIQAQGNASLKPGATVLKPVQVTIAGQAKGAVAMQVVSRGGSKLTKPVLNPVLSAYASAPLLKAGSVLKAQPQIMLNSIKPVTSGSPVLSQMRVVGQPVNVNGQQMNVVPKPVNIMGQPISMVGQPVSVVGQPVGQPVSVVGQPVSVVGQPLSVVGQPVSVVGQPVNVVGQPVSVIGQPINMVGQPLRFVSASSAQQFLASVSFTKTSSGAPGTVASTVVNGTSFQTQVTKTTSVLTNNNQMSMYPIRYAFPSNNDPTKVKQHVPSKVIEKSGADGKPNTVGLAFTTTSSSSVTSVAAAEKEVTICSATSSEQCSSTESPLAAVSTSSLQGVHGVSAKSCAPLLPSSCTPVSSVIASKAQQFIFTSSGVFRTVPSPGPVLQALPVSIGDVGVPSSVGIITSADGSLNGQCTTAPSVPQVVMTQKISPSGVSSAKLNKMTNMTASGSQNSEKKLGTKIKKMVRDNKAWADVTDKVNTIDDVKDIVSNKDGCGVTVDEEKGCVQSFESESGELDTPAAAYDSDGNGDLDSLGSSLHSFSSLGETGSIKSVESADANCWEVDSKDKDSEDVQKQSTGFGNSDVDNSGHADVSEILSVARRVGIEIANTLEPLDATPVKNVDSHTEEKVEEASVEDMATSKNVVKKKLSVNNGHHMEENLSHKDVSEILSAARKAGIDICSTLGPINNPSERTDILSDVVDVTKEVFSVEDEDDSDSCLLVDECFAATKDLTSAEGAQIAGCSKRTIKRKYDDLTSMTTGNPCKRAHMDNQTHSESDSLVLQIDDSEDSDVDIMSVDADCEVIQEQPPQQQTTQGSRRKSELRSREDLDAGTNVLVKGRNVRVADVEVKIPRHAGRTNGEKVRRQQLRVLFDRLALIVIRYNPKLLQQNFSNGMPKQMILQESLCLLHALKRKTERLKESLADGRQYNQRLQNQLKENIDSFIRSGVPPTIIKNFLKSVSTATLASLAIEGKIGASANDSDADLDYPEPKVPVTPIQQQSMVQTPSPEPLLKPKISLPIVHTGISKEHPNQVIDSVISQNPVSLDNQSVDTDSKPFHLYIDNPESCTSEFSVDVDTQEAASSSVLVEMDEDELEVKSTTGDDALLEELMDPEQWNLLDEEQSENLLSDITMNQSDLD